MKKLILIMLLISGCHGYQVHPGSINTFDSQTADTLLQAKTLLDNSKASLTPAVKPLWVNLAKAYDVAEASYKTWRGLAINNQDVAAQQQALVVNIAELVTSIANFQGAAK